MNGPSNECRVAHRRAAMSAPDNVAWSMAVPEVVRLPADLDADQAGLVRDNLHAAISRAIAMVIADMTETRRCDYAGLCVLVDSIKEAAACHVELRIVLPAEGMPDCSSWAWSVLSRCTARSRPC